MDLIMDANHDIGKFYLNGKLKTIKRGQSWTSVRTLAERWGWRNEDVLNFLKALEEDGMITRFSTQSGTLLTLVNYGKFQDARNTNWNGRRNANRNDQRNDHRNETKKDKRTTKEGKKEETLPPEGNQQSEEEDLSAWEALEDDDAVEH